MQRKELRTMSDDKDIIHTQCNELASEIAIWLTEYKDYKTDLYKKHQRKLRKVIKVLKEVKQIAGYEL